MTVSGDRRGSLSPLETLFDVSQGAAMPLGDELQRLYGALRLPLPPGRSWVIGNFVSTLDGVTVLDDPMLHGGGEISGHLAADRAVMGILRSVAQAIVVGAGTLRDVPRHIWTAQHIYPDLSDQYTAVRRVLGLAPQPLNVFVTARGELDLGLRVFSTGLTPVLIVTTQGGAARLRRAAVPPSVEVVAVDGNSVSAVAILDAICHRTPGGVVLVEGGPQLMSVFFAEQTLDEMYLTVAPQVAGRDGKTNRPGFVAGALFAPHNPRWGQIVSIKRAGSHLFLRYQFPHQ